jgi:hypothetical protein
MQPSPELTDDLMEQKFSVWFQWQNRNEYADISFPGIYVIAASDNSIAGNIFSFRNEIVYIGMANAVAGLKGRLTQFDNTLAGDRFQHGRHVRPASWLAA